MSDEVYEWPWPTGPGADHILQLQRELAQRIANRVPIFMDTNFWIMAREAAFGEKEDRELVSLLGALRLAVQSGKIFFPITRDLIIEFSKQTPERLALIMQLVDQLSLGIAMVPHNERVAMEMEAFNASLHPDFPPEPRPLWTSYAFAFGYQDFRPKGIKVDEELLVALADTAWNAQPSMLAQALPSSMFKAKRESEELADFLNKQEALYAREIDSHATAVRIEVAGASDLLQGVAAREYRRIAAAMGQGTQAIDIRNSHRVGKKIAAMVGEALKQKRHQRSFGSLFVPAMLHAAVRAEAGRKIKPNDIDDFRHAAAALPYCRAFFTDGPLRSLIASGHVALDRLYACEVASSPSDAIKVISRIALE